MTVLPESATRVLNAARKMDLTIDIRVMDRSTRTAEEAAAACGCEVGQIVKSLIFKGRNTGIPILLLVSGSNRVDQERAETVIGEPLDRPNADFVRDTTGFAIGGVPPFGHAAELRTYIDRDLLDYPMIWAAAGTPKAVFAVTPRELTDKTGATVMRVC